ncbi:MAG: cysteine--tRNA ligase [Candidatus Krumholzibacteriota bacterium]|nr:cysteine--tRNA ligase [Candidatus Krumholzibacteriota bacterium]
MTLKVYDTLRRKKEEFKPVREGKVGIYFCGMTVQDKPHMGHMLAFVAGDMIKRYLRYSGYDVTYIQNFTDVDDKIIAKANEEGLEYQDIAERYIGEYFKYEKELNILPADKYPRATEHIGDIIGMVQKLIDKGAAYESEGDVYFRVRQCSFYGKLSGRKIDELKSGARIETGDSKEDDLDFTLWKAAKEGEPAWESPWGRGRPGWHIECSVMSMKYLGETVDMHGGGQDLVFPHHENEIAQSESATGHNYVNYWLHNGLLNLQGEKMSKSTGHFFSIEDICQEFSGEVVRFYLLSTHFRSRTEFGRDRLKEAEAGFERIKNVCIYLDELSSSAPAEGVESPAANGGERLLGFVDDVEKDFFAAMDDDFNSGEAIGHIFRLVKEINRIKAENPGLLGHDPEAVKRVLSLFGLFDTILGLFRDGLPSSGLELPDEVGLLVAKREEARKEGDWGSADRLRDEILGMGFMVEDGPAGPKIKPLKGH